MTDMLIDKVVNGAGDAMSKTLNTWLDLVTKSKQWQLLHVGGMLTVSATEGMINTSGIGFGGTQDKVNQLRSFTNSGGISSKAAEVINKAYEYVRDPNISGIVIHSSSEKCERSVDVSERAVLSTIDAGTESQNTAVTKSYAIDNAAPKLREWTYDGYLVSTSIFASSLVVKDDLLLKSMLLDFYAKSRKPVMLKTSDMRFYKVLITNYSYEYTPEATNALHVQVTLKEFVVTDVTADNSKTKSFKSIKEAVAG